MIETVYSKWGVWMNGPAIGGWNIRGAWGAGLRTDSLKIQCMMMEPMEMLQQVTLFIQYSLNTRKTLQCWNGVQIWYQWRR